MLTREQYFEQWWPTTQQYRSLEQYRSSKLFDGKGYRTPNAGEIASVEQSMRASALSSGFDPVWNTFNTQQQAAVEALGQQQAAQEAAAAAAEQTKAATIVAKKSSALALSQQQQAAVRQAQETSTTGRVAQRQPTRAAARASVGQPGVARTRVGARLGIGGYSGTAAGNVNPTGLNV